MADTVDVKWSYPPNWGDAPNLSDDQRQGFRYIEVQLVGTSDASGETDVVKVDISTLRRADGQPVVKTAVEWMRWHVFGMTIVLEWDRTPHKEIYRINANGVMSDGSVCWQSSGGLVDPDDGTSGTGDILLTSTNADAGDMYEINMGIRLK